MEGEKETREWRCVHSDEWGLRGVRRFRLQTEAGANEYVRPLWLRRPAHDQSFSPILEMTLVGAKWLDRTCQWYKRSLSVKPSLRLSASLDLDASSSGSRNEIYVDTEKKRELFAPFRIEPQTIHGN